MGQVDEDASYVAISPNRTAVIRRLVKGNAMPTQIQDDTGLQYSRISEAVSDLRDQDLVDLVVDEDTKRGRLYSITDRGEAAWKYMVENNMVAEDK